MAEAMMWLALAAYVMTGVHLWLAWCWRERAAADLAETRRLQSTWDEVSARCDRILAAARRFSLLWRCGAHDQAVSALGADLCGGDAEPLAARSGRRAGGVSDRAS